MSDNFVEQRAAPSLGGNRHHSRVGTGAREQASLGEHRYFAGTGPVLLFRQIKDVAFFSFLMWAMFEATFTLGTIPMDWIAVGVDWFSRLVASVMPSGLLREILVDGIIAGVGGTLIFLPNIVILFFFLALMEESGYLARASQMMARSMKAVGLHGSAFIPLLMGFGCNVPAIMATRTISNRQSRLVAILISPFMACSARLPIFILFAGAFFESWAGTMVFVMYALSIAVAMLSATLLSRTVVGRHHDAVATDMPGYRFPDLKAVLRRVLDRALDFLRKIAGIILVGSIVIWFLQEFPRDGITETSLRQEIASLGMRPDSAARNIEIRRLEVKAVQAHLQDSYLGQVSRMVTPLFAPLGFNWRDTVAIMTGFLAKEVVVASYTVMYAQDSEVAPEAASVRQALAKTMTPVTAFAFMVFTLFYAPCLATVAAIKRETGGWRWPAFSFLFSLSLAWSLAFVIVAMERWVL